MRKSGKTIRLNPVDDDHHVTDHPARAGLEAIMDQKLFAQRIKSERASAYWFAASTWGIAGLVIGACAGAYMMYVASVATLPVAQDAIPRGMAMQEIQRQSDGRPGLLSPDRQQTP